tara:strand:- start:1102 stop:1251 length:150 start_codon:yes stop_codon:yes gene_type:complete
LETEHSLQYEALNANPERKMLADIPKFLGKIGSDMVQIWIAPLVLNKKR